MVAQLIRLKLTLTWNTLRKPVWVLVLTILGSLYGLSMLGAGTVGVVFATLNGADLFPVWIIGGGLVLLGWVVGPALLASLDNTLDPRRFAPYVGVSKKLAAGLVLGTGVGIAGVFSLLAILVPVVSMAVAQFYLPAVLGLILGLAGLLTAFLWSRALTTWMGVKIEGSGRRDKYTTFASLLILVICTPVGIWAQMASNSVDTTIWDQLRTVMSWTPFGAPWAICENVINGGAWAQAGARLAIMILWAGAGWALWMRVLPWAMAGTVNKVSDQVKQAIAGGVYQLDSGSSSGERDAKNGRVASKRRELVGLPGVEAWQRLGLSPAAASLAKKTARDWLRDPRLFIGAVSVVMMAVIGSFLQFMNGPASEVTTGVSAFNSGFGAFLVIWAPMLLGAVVGALDMYESTAMWILVASGMKGRDNRLARLVGSLPISLVVIVVSCGLFSWLTHLSVRSIVLLVVAAILSFCSSVAVTLVENARFVYPVQPPGTSAFSSKGTGQFGATFLIQIVGWLVACVVAVPGIVLLALAAWSPWVPVVVAVPVTVAWCVGVLIMGVIWGGKVWDRYNVSVLTHIKAWPGH